LIYGFTFQTSLTIEGFKTNIPNGNSSKVVLSLIVTLYNQIFDTVGELRAGKKKYKKVEV